MFSFYKCLLLRQIIDKLFKAGHVHFQEMSTGEVNATELIAALINTKENLIEWIEKRSKKI